LGTLSRALVAANVAYLAGVWAVIIGAFALVTARPSPLTIVVAIVVVSSRQQALLNVQHECIHALFLRGRRGNELVGVWLCASPCGSPYGSSKARHLAHHKLLGTPEDPDAPLHRGPGFATRARTIRTFVHGMFGAYAVKVLLGGGDAATDAAVRRSDRVHLAMTQVVLWAATAVVFAWWVYPVVWLLPLGTITVLGHQLRSFGEHALTPAEEIDHEGRLVSTRSNRLERILLAPYNMNLHAEHHLFPWVPAFRLPAVQHRLESGPADTPLLRRGSYLSTLRTYLRGLPA
jgi:fatty acid desaturase